MPSFLGRFGHLPAVNMWLAVACIFWPQMCCKKSVSVFCVAPYYQNGGSVMALPWGDLYHPVSFSAFGPALSWARHRLIKNDVPSANNLLLCEARRWSYNVEGHGRTPKSYTSNWTLALLQKYTMILWSLRKEATLLSTCFLDASIQHHCTRTKAERAL